jgi:polyisoprenoid-binding protein YceI
MRTRFFGLILIAALATAACASLIAPRVQSEPAALKAGAYALDPEHAAVVFKVNHLGYANFVGRFEKLEATLDFDDADPKLSRVEARIDIASLDVANDEFAATLTGPDWLDAGRFPEAVFRSTRIETTAANSGRVIGDMTLRGVTSPVALDVTFNGGARDFLRGGYVVGFSAKGEFSRKAFGVDRFDGIVGDPVIIEIEAEFVRR